MDDKVSVCGDVQSVYKKDWYRQMYNALHRPAHEPSQLSNTHLIRVFVPCGHCRPITEVDLCILNSKLCFQTARDHCYAPLAALAVQLVVR